jgi:hypothetical protein
MGQERKLYKVLVGKPERKRPLGRPRHTWEDGIRIDLRETDWEEGCGIDSVDSGQGPVVGSYEHDDTTSGSGAMDLVIYMYSSTQDNNL